jgi:type I restriction enzyme R subunit
MLAGMTKRSEAQTRFDLIDPALRGRGWQHPTHAYSAIRVEERDAAVEIIDGKARRRATKPKDYVLYWDCSGGTTPQPIAIVEAKREGLPPDYGLEQGKNYRKGRLRHVPTVLSTNGHLFVRFDEKTGLTSEPEALASFPRPEDLCAEQTEFLGFSPAESAAAPWTTPADLGSLHLRYYQDAAIRAALQKFVLDEKRSAAPRALLALATGSGKTKLAAALLKHLDASGRLTRALFVCDRDPLRASAIGEMQALFGSNAAVVSTGQPQLNAKVLVATYQTLGFTPQTDEPTAPISDDGAYPTNHPPASSPAAPPPGSFFVEHYPENYFNVVIIDECHRSAWGEWRVILDRNPHALHLGLTATPRRLKIPETAPDTDTAAKIASDARLLADNHTYFGEPVYSYDYLDGVEDGYLAPCEIRTFDLFHDDQTLPERVRGILRADVLHKKISHALTGEKLTPDAVAETNAPSRLDASIVLVERTQTFAAHFFEKLLAAGDGDPHQKTIIFCQSDPHARRVATELNNFYARWCTEHGRRRVPKFAFQCTASTDGQELIPEFRSRQTSHFIATTVDLLSTGVDVPCVRHIVFFRFLQSPILFHQMVGRGTRIDEGTGKLMFTLWDYTGATALFGRDFETPPPPPPEGDEPPPGPDPGPDGPPPVQVRTTRIEIKPAGDFQVLNLNGRVTRVTPEHYRALLTEKLAALSPDLSDFRTRWVDRTTKKDLLDALQAQGLYVDRLPDLAQQADYDLFDLLAALVYDVKPLTRSERAARFLETATPWLVQLPQPTADVVRRIVKQFEAGGTEALETNELFRQVAPAGANAIALLKQAGDPQDVMRKIKQGLFVA